MIAALLVLSPTALAVLAAVCSPRLGLAALHGQLLYLAALLLYSPFALTVNSLWMVPCLAGLLFFCGTALGFFIVRADINPKSEKARRVFTGVLVLVNFFLLFFLLHSIFGIMCFRLDEAMGLGAVRIFALVFKVGSGVLLIWLLACILKKRRRLGWAALYAELGLIFSTYIILAASAGKVTRPMPMQLQRALEIRSGMEYYTIAASAEFLQFTYFLPPVCAVLCGVTGYFLLKPAQGSAAK